MKLLLLIVLILIVLLALFVGWYSWELLGGGNFSLQNIFTGELPEDYITGEGSTFNAVRFVMSVELFLIFVLGLGLLMRKVGSRRWAK